MALKLLNYSGLTEKGIHYSKSQLNRKMKDGSFPRAVDGAGKENVWVEEEIDRYITDRIAARLLKRLTPPAGASRSA